MKVNAAEWNIAIFLQTASFKKASVGTVWADSKRAILMSLPVSIDTMKSTINRRGGIARGNRFGVYIHHPSKGMNSLLEFDPATLLSNLISGRGVNVGDFISDPRDMFLLCQKCSIPGKRITTTEATHNHHICQRSHIQ